jgi:5'-nucleotidase
VDRALTILVDLDGPVFEFDGHFYAKAAERGWDLHSTQATQCHRYATGCVIDPEHAREARAMIDNDPDWFRNLPLVDGARDGLNDLVDCGHEVWLCTKPLEANLWCRDGKAEAVRTHLGPEWERRLIITPDKSMVEGHLLLDDAPKREWFGRARWAPVIYPTTWNGTGSEWEGLPRWRWGDPIGVLTACGAWGRRHG